MIDKLWGDLPPSGCHWCGVERRAHAWISHPPVGYHQYQHPDQELIKARMILRRESAHRAAARHLYACGTDNDGYPTCQGDGEPCATPCAALPADPNPERATP